MRDANWSWARKFVEDTGLVGGDAGVVDADVGDVGGLRPATNITGASWAKSSIGYEFIAVVRP